MVFITMLIRNMPVGSIYYMTRILSLGFKTVLTRSEIWGFISGMTRNLLEVFIYFVTRI